METRTIYEERLMNVLDEVSIYVFGKPLASYIVKSRRRELVEVREMFCLLLREKTDYSYSQIGCLFGLNHATVFYEEKTAKDLISIYPRLKEEYELLEQKFTELL
jgi:chromosomal replication initiation ATPase DnaA